MCHRLFVALSKGRIADITVCGVNIDKVRLEPHQLVGREHCVLPVLSVFGQVKLRFKSVIQQKKLQLVRNSIGG